MRMPGGAPGAAAQALPLCVTGGALRWVVDMAGRPPQQSSAGALARADSAYSVSDKNWRSSKVILPRTGRADAWCGTGCRYKGLAVPDPDPSMRNIDPQRAARALAQGAAGPIIRAEA